MTLEDRINGLVSLKEAIEKLGVEEKEDLFFKASSNNPWFTHENIDMAFNGIKIFLEEEALNNWVENYKLPSSPLRIGIVMAGNIPMVGFHDFLSVVIAGHIAVVKQSSQDNVLLKKLIELLTEINPGFQDLFELVDTLPEVDAVIATGSDNSARYFKKYFSKMPHIIRKNRTSIAVLDGKETNQELESLGIDIFSYFGLGCRNISKILVPKGYQMKKLLDALSGYKEIANHTKYFNNYEYNKAIYLVNQIPHLDTGFLLLTESSDITSPLSVLFYEEYRDEEQLNKNVI